MKPFQFLIAALIAIFLCTSQKSFAEGGWLRDKIKQRLIQKQLEKPAPEVSSDINLKIEKAGTYTFSFKFDELDRYYILHVPQKYSSKKSAPLVLALHGGGGDMTIQSNDEYYNQISKSESEGYIVAFPNGSSPFKSGKFATWNAGRCCGKARDKKVDDVGFIKEMLVHISKQLNIDSSRVFATGMSNGAMMSYRLACEMPETFKAIAAVAGTDNTIQCDPKKPVSILHIHAKNDDHVLFNGGAGKTFTDKDSVTDFTSVASSMNRWIKINGCEAAPKKILEKPDVYCDQYLKCKNKVEMQLCVTEKGGHSWPGGKKPREGNEAPSKAISATDVIWDFFKNK